MRLWLGARRAARAGLVRAEEESSRARPDRGCGCKAGEEGAVGTPGAAWSCRDCPPDFLGFLVSVTSGSACVFAVLGGISSGPMCWRSSVSVTEMVFLRVLWCTLRFASANNNFTTNVYPVLP